MKDKILDKQIAQEYHKRAGGKTIAILEVPKLFAYARKRVVEGEDLGAAVQEAINQFCKDE